MSITITEPSQIRIAAALSVKYRLALELKGLRFSGSRSTFAVIRQKYGFKGSRERVYQQYCKHWGFAP